MKRFLRALLIAALFVMPALADSGLPRTVHRLESDRDARVRVRAALELGKSRNPRYRAQLERALSDASPSVRAAAAAALRVLGDARAIPALQRRASDRSSSVRAQVKSSIAALKRREAQANGAKVVVMLGDISAAEKERRAEAVLKQLKNESRRKLDDLPGVLVLDEAGAGQGALGRELPVVLVTGHLKRTDESRDSSGITYFAKVEYLVHAMPGKSIVGLISGSASARASAIDAKSAKRMAELRREVLVAAIDSALRRAPEAIEAAAH